MILVIAEQKDGKLNRASWETIAAAQQLSGGAMPIKVAVAGQGVAAVAASSRRRRSPRCIAVDHAALAHYTPDAFVQALQQVVTAGVAGLVFLPHTYQTRDFSPTLGDAARSRARHRRDRREASRRRRRHSRGRCSRAS